jgi:hypothetical protein
MSGDSVPQPDFSPHAHNFKIKSFRWLSATNVEEQVAAISGS